MIEATDEATATGRNPPPAGPGTASAPGAVVRAPRAPTLRVLYINSGNLHGGVESLLSALARHRDACPEMEPHFACSYAGRSSRELDEAGVPVHLLGEVRARRPLSVLRARRMLSTLLRRERFDAVICHSVWSQAVFGPSTRPAGIPLVFWLHDPPGERLHWLEHWARRTPPDFILCNSRYTAGRAGRLYPGVPTGLVYCPVPPPGDPAADRDETRAGLGAAPGTTAIVQVGRWEPHKGHLLHLEALGRLAGRRDWVCWQVGAPQRPHERAYQERVRDSARRLGIADRVRFLGWQPDLGRLLAAADLYCQPNTGPEPFGITYVEALYAGLPALATPLGGPAEILDETCGVLVPPGDVAALADALAALMDDPGRRARLGAAGPARARQLCDPPAALARLRDLLTGAARARLAPA